MSQSTLEHCVTVDEKDNAVFSLYNSAWWYPVEGRLTHLKALNRLTFEFLLKSLPNDYVKGDKTIIDVGCGGGIVSEKLAKVGFAVVGIDPNPDVIKVAQEHASLDKTLTNLSYRFDCIEGHALENQEKYDIVVLNYVLQHAINQDVLLSNCVKVLKPGGHIFLTGIGKTFRAWIKVKLVLGIILRTMALQSHNWNNFITCGNVEDILKLNNCSIKSRKGMYYNVWKSSWEWQDNTDSFYIIHATKN